MKQLKPFSKIGPTVPLTEAPLVRLKGWTKGRVRLVSSIFFTKILILFTPAIFYTHLLYPRITFLWHTLYFSLHMHSPIIRVIIYFERIIIDIIIYGRKRKMYIIFGRKIKYMPSLWHGEIGFVQQTITTNH